MKPPWPLPDYAHVPGLNARPMESPAFDAAAAAPRRTEPANWATNATYVYGVSLYNEGFFWEAHEVWEPVWMRCQPNSEARQLVRGLIQLANAGLKVRMGRPEATDRLLTLTEAHMRSAGGEMLMGISPVDLADRVAAYRAAAISDGLEHRPNIELKYAL